MFRSAIGLSVRRERDGAEVAEVVAAHGDGAGDVAIDAGFIGLEHRQAVLARAAGQAQPDAPFAGFRFREPDFLDRAAAFQEPVDVARADREVGVGRDDPGLLAGVRLCLPLSHHLLRQSLLPYYRA